MSWIAGTLSIVGLALAATALVDPGIGKPIWVAWVILPPLWFIFEYQAKFRGWFGSKSTEADLEHLKHMQSLMLGIWVSVAAVLYWRVMEKGEF
jgi:hypothetical protein